MAMSLVNRREFPSRPPALAASHPLLGGGAARHVTVANADGSVTNLLTGGTYNWPTAATQGGGVDAWGPYGAPASTGNWGIPIPVVIPSETIQQFTMACILGCNTPSYAQTMVANSHTSGAGLVIENGGAMRLALAGATLLVNWPTLTPGHAYIVVASGVWTSGAHSPRDWGWVHDLTTGQLWFDKDNATGLGITVDATSYSVITYSSGGSTARNRFYAGALSMQAIPISTQLDWILNDPWGLWYADDVPVIMGLAAKRVQAAAAKLSPALMIGL